MSLTCVSCLLLSGCGRHHGEVSFQTDGVIQTVRQGQIALRVGFPLPIYPHAQPSGSVSATSKQDHEDDRFLMLFSNDELNLVADFYKKALNSSGWKIENTQEFPDMVNIIACKDNQEAGVMLTASSGKTTISLSVSHIDTGSLTTSEPAAVDSKTGTSNKLNLPDD